MEAVFLCSRRHCPSSFPARFALDTVDGFDDSRTLVGDQNHFFEVGSQFKTEVQTIGYVIQNRVCTLALQFLVVYDGRIESVSPVRQ